MKADEKIKARAGAKARSYLDYTPEEILGLSVEEKAKINAWVEAELAELEGNRKKFEKENPFYYWKPNDGEITEGRREVLRRWIHEEDIPIKIDSQLDVLLSKADIRGVSGGNGSGKTEIGCIGAAIKLTGELPLSLMGYKEGHFEGIIRRAKEKFIKGRLTAVDNRQLHTKVLPVWQDIWKDMTLRNYLKNGKWEDSYNKEFDILYLYRGGQKCAAVEFLTNAQDTESSQGGDLDFAIFDEEPDRDKYKETIMRFRSADKLDIEIDWTPTRGITWATNLFHLGIELDDDKDKTRDLFKLTTVTNTHLNTQTLIKMFDEFAEISSYEEMKMRLLGEAISLSGLVYGNLFNNSIHIIEPFYENLDVKQKKLYVCNSGWDLHFVTPMAGVFLLTDKENNHYVDLCYWGNVDTDELKQDFHAIVKERGYRMGWSVCDKSSDSSIIAFGGKNLYKEVSRSSIVYFKNGEVIQSRRLPAIPALRTSVKYEGSIKAGVNEIKKMLKINDITGKPRLFIVNRPENKQLIQAFKMLERDTYSNETDKGQKDRIKEGPYHLHAALRYIFQFPVNWYDADVVIPQPIYFDDVACW